MHISRGNAARPIGLPRKEIDRLVKAILLLGSAVSDEAAAAAGAITRLLEANGRSLNDLAEVIRRGLVVELPLNPLRPPDPDWRSALEVCVDHVQELAPKEREFVANMQKVCTNPTVKQAQWLRDIAARYSNGKAA